MIRLCRPILAALLLSFSLLAGAPIRPLGAQEHPTIRLRVDGSPVYSVEREVELAEALIFDTLSVFIGGAKGAGGIGRARVGTYGVFVYLSNRERGCGRLQEVVPSLTPPKKRAEEFARRIAAEKPDPNAPFVPFDASDAEAFDLQLQAIDFLDHDVLAPFEGKRAPRWWTLLSLATPEGAHFSGPRPEVRLLHGGVGSALPACPDPAKGWLPTVAPEDLAACHVLPFRFSKAQRKAQPWTPIRDSTGVSIGQSLDLWWIVPPASDPFAENPDRTEPADGYRVVWSIDAEHWSLEADVPARRCPGLKHVHVELE